MIVKFSVENFRSIRSKITLDFRATSIDDFSRYYIQEYPNFNLRLLKMAMIFGKNASGKTNTIRALDFLGQFVVAKAADKNLPTGVQPFALDKDKDTDFGIEFVYEDYYFKYDLCLRTEKIVNEELSVWQDGDFSRVFSRKSIKDGTHSSYRYDWSGSGADEILISLLKLTIPTQSILTRLKEYEYSGLMQKAYDWFNTTLVPVVTPYTKLIDWNANKFLTSLNECDYKEFFVNQLKSADFIIKDIEVEKKEVMLHELPVQELAQILAQVALEGKKEIPKRIEKNDIQFLHKVVDGEYKLDITDQSEGTVRFLELCGLLCWIQEVDRVVSIDEIERSMHEDLLEHFIATYLTLARKSQLIFTSQNSSIMSKKEIIRNDTIWICDRDENGGTELTRITDYPIEEVPSVEQAYKLGMLGGKPKLGGITTERSDE